MEPFLKFLKAGHGMKDNDFLSIESLNPAHLCELTNVNITGRWAFEVSTKPYAPDVPDIFYPFFYGNYFDPIASTEISQEVKLNQSIWIFRHQQSSIYVSWNGFLSSSAPDDINDSTYLIVPFWSKFNKDNHSKVAYEEVTKGHRLSRATKDISVMFKKGFYDSTWTASRLFIATWFMMPFERSTGNATFQVVLVSTEGQKTFAIMNYGDISSTYEPWQAGYLSADESNKYFINELDSANLSSTSNVKTPGRWIFEIDGRPPTPCEIVPCVEDEVCVERYGHTSCACANSNEKPNPDTFDATETCVGSNSSLSLSYCQIFDAGYIPETLHLYDPSCRGIKENNRLVFHFDSHHNLCGTNLTHNSTHFTYINAVGTSDKPLGLISRSGGLNIAFSCVYPLIQSISMPMAIQTTGSVVSKELSTEGTYTIRMIPYEDQGFQYPFSGNVTLEVNQQVYVGVTVEEFDQEQIATVLDSCWATPVDDINSYPRWDLITGECPNPADSTVEVLQNGVSTSSFFSFRMFSFTGDSNNIYLHCQVHLCLLEGGNCATSCGGSEARGRRSVNFHDSAFISMGF
ncbi:alpha-tectorin-like isoform X2 [Trichomycterus rosablanca]|uniref:alpha-tectorin-like isoform X2 n=1 Tax=Trichomycterus rosablanca TaxID=2290929 RepID=UPI002F353B1F